MIKISARFRGWTHRTTLSLLCPTRCTNIDENQIPCPHHKDGDIIPLFIFSHGLRLNTEADVKCLEEVLLPWIERLTAWRRPYVWQQDSVPCHTSRKSWLSENFCNHMTPNTWLPNSLDCNSLGYYVWYVVQQETNKTPCHTKDELKARITATFINLNKGNIGKVCRRFWSLLEVIVKGSDNIFE